MADHMECTIHTIYKRERGASPFTVCVWIVAMLLAMGMVPMQADDLPTAAADTIVFDDLALPMQGDSSPMPNAESEGDEGGIFDFLSAPELRAAAAITPPPAPVAQPEGSIIVRPRPPAIVPGERIGGGVETGSASEGAASAIPSLEPDNKEKSKVAPQFINYRTENAQPAYIVGEAHADLNNRHIDKVPTTREWIFLFFSHLQEHDYAALGPLAEKIGTLEFHDYHHRTPLIYATQAGDNEAVRHLIALGAKLDGRDDKERTALHYSIEQQYYAISHLLLVNHARADLADKAGESPLSMALAKHDGRAIEDIVNAAAVRMETLDAMLISMVRQNDVKAVNMLLHYGANVDGRDENGNTPLIVAVLYNHHHLINLLLAAGANPSIVNNEGLTACDLGLVPTTTTTLPRPHIDHAVLPNMPSDRLTREEIQAEKAEKARAAEEAAMAAEEEAKAAEEAARAAEEEARERAETEARQAAAASAPAPAPEVISPREATSASMPLAAPDEEAPLDATGFSFDEEMGAMPTPPSLDSLPEPASITAPNAALPPVTHPDEELLILPPDLR